MLRRDRSTGSCPYRSFRAPKGVVGLAGSSKSDMKSAVPSLAKAIQGSLARAALPPVHSVTPGGFGGIGFVQVEPPSLDKAPMSPRAPPSDQRSC